MFKSISFILANLYNFIRGKKKRKCLLFRTKRKKKTNLPIFIRALLLHLDSLVQLAVRGAKVVIPFHV